MGPWNQGKLAILCNYGSLLQPTTKAQYQSNVGGAFRPYQLFSHSDQVNQQMTSICKTTGQTGWGGRVADNTGSLNGATVLPMAVSVSGRICLRRESTPGNYQSEPARFRVFLISAGMARPQRIPSPPEAVSVNYWGLILQRL
jgi:hypothetical protein